MEQDIKTGRRRSLLTRAIIGNVFLVSLTVVTLAVVLPYGQFTALSRQLELRADSVADFLASQSGFGLLVGDRMELERIAANAVAIEDVLYAVITDSQGAIVARAGQSDIPPGGPANTGRISTPDGPVQYLEVSRAVMEPEGDELFDWEDASGALRRLGEIRVGFSMAKHQALLARTVKSVLAVAVIAIAVFLGFEYFQLRRLLAPLKDLIAFTKRVSKGDLSERAPGAEPGRGR